MIIPHFRKPKRSATANKNTGHPLRFCGGCPARLFFLYQGGKIRAKDFPASALLLVLQRVVAALAGAHFHDVLHGVDENLAVADVAGVESLFRRLDDSGDRHF